MKGLNGPFPGFRRGVIFKDVTLYAFSRPLSFGEKAVCLRCAKEGGSTQPKGFQKLFS
jgi:hypothetical protein